MIVGLEDKDFYPKFNSVFNNMIISYFESYLDENINVFKKHKEWSTNKKEITKVTRLIEDLKKIDEYINSCPLQLGYDYCQEMNKLCKKTYKEIGKLLPNMYISNTYYQ